MFLFLFLHVEVWARGGTSLLKGPDFKTDSHIRFNFISCRRFYVNVELLWTLWHIMYSHRWIVWYQKQTNTVADIQAHLAIRLSASKRRVRTNYLRLYRSCFGINKLDFVLLESNRSFVLQTFFAFDTNPVVFVSIAKPYNTQCFKYTF